MNQKIKDDLVFIGLIGIPAICEILIFMYCIYM